MHEKIARKKRSDDAFLFSPMADVFSLTRQIHSILLPLKMGERLELFARMGVHGIPKRPVCHDHFLALPPAAPETARDRDTIFATTDGI